MSLWLIDVGRAATSSKARRADTEKTTDIREMLDPGMDARSG